MLDKIQRRKVTYQQSFEKKTIMIANWDYKLGSNSLPENNKKEGLGVSNKVSPQDCVNEM